MTITNAIADYHQSNVGYAWDKFWDYKCSVEATGVSILSAGYIATTSQNLLSYLFAFGMRRKTKLVNLTSFQFQQVLHNLSTEYAAIQHIRLETLSLADRQGVVRLFDATEHALENQGVSATVTLVTKIHMALWGTVPAYDILFRRAYRDFFTGLPFPSRPASLFDSLLQLQNCYNARWKPLITQLNTRSGGQQPIPVARLIDMAFWQYGKCQDANNPRPYVF